MTSTLPFATAEFLNSKGFRLVFQGFMLHIATIAGPVDVFRKGGQRQKALRLFFNEYGLNLLLFALLQLLIYIYVPATYYLLAEIAAIAFLILMSVIQMFVDYSREPINIYHSARHEAGISVRVAGENSWAFFNHYALPVGRKYGVHLRSELHRQAEDQHYLLYCYAQNMDVANHYLREHPKGTLADTSKRPLLVWDYRDDKDKTDQVPMSLKAKKFDPFGFHSARNSGSLPIK